MKQLIILSGKGGTGTQDYQVRENGNSDKEQCDELVLDHQIHK